jgi:hypothetical protein
MDDPRRDGGAPTDRDRSSADVVKGPGFATTPPNGPGPTPRRAAQAPRDARAAGLSAALRRARIDSAEHSGVLADLRSAEIARLEILRDQLDPVIAQVSKDCDLFDVAISPGERPRLFIDAIGFVEMSRDRRGYRFLQDTRHGRIAIAETEKVETMVEAITAYMAHRLIEREKALAVDYASGGAASVAGARAAAAPIQRDAPRSGPVRLPHRSFQIFLFFMEFIGSAVFFSLLALLGFWLYRTYATS